MAEVNNYYKSDIKVQADTLKMNHKLEGKIFETGEKGPFGRYVCTNCIGVLDNFIEIAQPNMTLPECSACGSTTWYKVSMD